mmetsp:Transcript_24105/g.72606  ORF Transcript_24105/g.72606 Transcript_24105/m.72606 type:complete len:260 (-) Transcript_24105:922-1701(-)
MAMRFGSAPKSISIVSDGWSAADFATSVDLSTSTSGVVCGARVPSSTASSAGGPTQPAHVAAMRARIVWWSPNASVGHRALSIATLGSAPARSSVAVALMELTATEMSGRCPSIPSADAPCSQRSSIAASKAATASAWPPRFIAAASPCAATASGGAAKPSASASTLSGSAPRSRRNARAARRGRMTGPSDPCCSNDAASAVSPLASVASRSAPRSASSVRMSTWSPCAAPMAGVQPRTLFLLTSAPRSTKNVARPRYP